MDRRLRPLAEIAENGVGRPDFCRSALQYRQGGLGRVRLARRLHRMVAAMDRTGFPRPEAARKPVRVWFFEDSRRPHRPAAKFFAGCKWLVWSYKNKANLTKDWGRSHESILHYRMSRHATFNVNDVRIPYGRHTLKYPVHPQAESSQYGGAKPGREDWRPHPQGAKPKDVFEIPVTSNGMQEKTPHPTQNRKNWSESSSSLRRMKAI